MRNFTGVSHRVAARLDPGRNGLWRDGGSGAESVFRCLSNRVYVIFTLRADLFTQFFHSAL